MADKIHLDKLYSSTGDDLKKNMFSAYDMNFSALMVDLYRSEQTIGN
jgi:hypothetical protein